MDGSPTAGFATRVAAPDGGSVTVTNMTEDSTDLYARLGVSIDAPVEVIDAAYKALLKRNHPDLAAGDSDRQARELICRNLGEAHATLHDPDSRQRYDRAREKENSRDARANADSSRPREDSAAPGTPAPRTPGTAQSRNRSSASSAAQDEEPRSFVLDPQGRPLAEYDDLTWQLKRQLTSLATSDREWRMIRRALLRRRVRVFGIPVVWFGLRGEPNRPASTSTPRMMLMAAALGLLGTAAAVIMWRTDALAAWATARHPFHWAPLRPQLDLVPALAMIALGAFLAVAVWRVLYPKVSRWHRGPLRAALTLGGVYTALLLAPYLAVLVLPVAVVAFAAKLWARHR